VLVLYRIKIKTWFGLILPNCGREEGNRAREGLHGFHYDISSLKDIS
jgi:hypothetical protein